MTRVWIIVISLLVFAGVSLFAAYGASLFSAGKRELRRHIEARSLSELDALYGTVDADKYFFFSVLCIVLFAGLLGAVTRGVVGLLAGAGVGYLGPRIYLRILIAQQKKLFHRQLPDGLSIMTNALRAGNSLVQALEIVADEMEGPLSRNFRYVLQRHRMGEPLAECLAALAEREQDDDLSMAVTATLVSLQTGSNLAEMYERLAATIRRKETMQNKIRSLTSQGKMQGWVVGFLPVGLLFVVGFLSPSSTEFFFHSFAGGVLLSIGVVMEFLGIAAIRRIVRIDV